MAFQRLALPGCLVAAILVVPALAAAQPDPVDNPLGYSTSGPGSAARCQTVQYVLTPSHGGAIWDLLWWNGGLRLERGTVEYGTPDSHSPMTIAYPHGAPWNLSTWNNGAIWFQSAPLGPATLEFTVIGNPGTRPAVWSSYGWDNYGNTPYSSNVVYLTITGSAGTNMSVMANPAKIDADGQSTSAISVGLKDAGCAPLANVDVRIATTLGTLRAGSQQGAQYVLVRTGSRGEASAVLVAGKDAGVASISATADSIGVSGSTTVELEKSLILAIAADRDQIPADGSTPDLLTVSLTNNKGVGMAGESVVVSTTHGTLVDPLAGGQPASSVTVTTNSSGSAYLNLIPSTTPTTPGKAVVTATHTTASDSSQATTEVEFVGFTLTLTVGDATLKSVAALRPDPPKDGVFLKPENGVGLATRFGKTEVDVQITLTHGDGATDLAGKVIDIWSGEQALVGSTYISFPSTVTIPDNTGIAHFTVTIDSLWKAPSEVGSITLRCAVSIDPLTRDEAQITVLDNLAVLVNHYLSDPAAMTDPLTHAQVPWGVPRGQVLDSKVIAPPPDGCLQSQIEPWRWNTLSRLPAGFRNDELANSAYEHLNCTDSTGQPVDFTKFTAVWYLKYALDYLNRVHWTRHPSLGYLDYLLNGLDYAPLFLYGVRYTVVVVYPRGAEQGEGQGQTPAWQWPSARVLDGWTDQQPAVSTWTNWKLAHPSRYSTSQFGPEPYDWGLPEVDFGAGYPANGGPYPAGGYTIPDPPVVGTTTTIGVFCPVYVTVTDQQGRQAGAAPPPASDTYLDEIPRLRWSVQPTSDGTLGWAFELPAVPLTVTIRGYAPGTMTLWMTDPETGKVWGYKDVPVSATDVASFAYTPGSSMLPPLVFTDGRSVPAFSSPVTMAGVWPKHGAALGGTAVSVSGIEVQPGATVTIGGTAATDVEYVHGTALTAVTGKAVRVGPVDVVVTNPGAAPVTLAKAFTYETPSGLVDLNADGLGDIVFYQPDSGRSAMTMADGQGGFAATLGQWSPDWTIRAGDFTGDGATDLFFYNGVTGAWYVGVNDGQGTYQYLPGQWAAGWTVLVLDLNADTQADVFVYNQATGAWYQCLTTTPGTFAYHAGQWSPGWGLWAGDFDGNGAGDVLVYNRATGSWYECLSDAVGGFSYVAGQWSPGWEVSVGDLNGDGRSDVFVYNATTGAWYVCLTTDGGFVYTPGSWLAGWQVSVGDFDADGMADVFVYNPVSGFWYVCQSDGAGGFVPAGGQWDPAWEVHVTDLNGDAQADVLVYNAATGRYYQCVTTGLGTFAYTAGQWDAGWTLLTTTAR